MLFLKVLRWSATAIVTVSAGGLVLSLAGLFAVVRAASRPNSLNTGQSAAGLVFVGAICVAGLALGSLVLLVGARVSAARRGPPSTPPPRTNPNAADST